MKKGDKNKKEIIDSLKKDLERVLKKGWKEFPKHKQYKSLKEYADHLRETGFFESKFRGRIAHPAHQYASEVIGIYVLKTLMKHDVHLDQFFPGDYLVSTTTDVEDKKIGDYDNRNFHMKAWKDGKRLCEITFSFPHLHGKFSFPKSPFVTIGKIY